MEISAARNHIIDRLQSKMMTIDEFNYDHLMAPPLYSFLTQSDIDQLRYIATSIRYSGKINQKYKAIDQIMNPRGFVKLVAGTNRVCYRHLEYDNIVVKVAVDAVGIHDNPEEFKNQHIFKPFVTKVFEVSPCGTVGLFERVIPITSREEFLSVAKEVFDVISNWFIGEYVLADIGTKFFMNWGIRKGFGPVLLDFPYCYPIDGNKLYCKNLDPNNPTGFCDGVIDYDDGYNFLYCTKCGTKYKATDLKKAIETKQIIIKGGKCKMAKELIVKPGRYKIDENGNIIDDAVDNGQVNFKPAATKISGTNNFTRKSGKDIIKELVVSTERVLVDDKGREIRKDERKKFRDERAQEYKKQQNKQKHNNQQQYQKREDTSMNRGTVMNPKVDIPAKNPEEDVVTSGYISTPVDLKDVPDDHHLEYVSEKDPSKQVIVLEPEPGNFGYFSSLDKEHGIMFVTVKGVPFPIKLSSIPEYAMIEMSDIENVQLELENAKKDLGDTEDLLDKANEKISEQEKLIENLRGEKSDLEQDKKELMDQINDLSETKIKLERDLLDTTSDLTMYKKKIEEVDKLNEQINSLQQNLQDYMSKCAELESRNSNLEKEVTRLGHVIDDKKKEINAVNAELANVKEAYDDAMHQMYEMESSEGESDKNPSEPANEEVKESTEKPSPYFYNGIWLLDSRAIKVKDCIDIYKVDPKNISKDIMDNTILLLRTNDLGYLEDVDHDMVGVITLNGESLKPIDSVAEEAEKLYQKYADTIPKDDEEENENKQHD